MVFTSGCDLKICRGAAVFDHRGPRLYRPARLCRRVRDARQADAASISCWRPASFRSGQALAWSRAAAVGGTWPGPDRRAFPGGDGEFCGNLFPSPAGIHGGASFRPQRRRSRGQIRAIERRASSRARQQGGQARSGEVNRVPAGLTWPDRST